MTNGIFGRAIKYFEMFETVFKYLFEKKGARIQRFFLVILVVIALYTFANLSGLRFQFVKQKIEVIKNANELIKDPSIDSSIKSNLKKEILEVSSDEDIITTTKVFLQESVFSKSKSTSKVDNGVFSTFWGWLIHLIAATGFLFIILIFQFINSPWNLILQGQKVWQYNMLLALTSIICTFTILYFLNSKSDSYFITIIVDLIGQLFFTILLAIVSMAIEKKYGKKNKAINKTPPV